MPKYYDTASDALEALREAPQEGATVKQSKANDRWFISVSKTSTPPEVVDNQYRVESLPKLHTELVEDIIQSVLASGEPSSTRRRWYEFWKRS